ncbi:DUF4352 domain-containing protein [Streptomyces sp. NPDC086782]|uniref:DUF4352 domain-containing protein n=1 Tax=Streptomyces sp. NPDC086782 TaxID=3365757 RepID=UPI003830F6C0
MRAFIRRGSVPAIVLSAALLTGCSGASQADDTGSASKPPAAVEVAGEGPSEDAPSSKPAPVLSVGQTDTWDYGEDDANGDFRVTSKMQVTVVSAKYATPAEVGTTNKPEHGQYVVLTLTLKNVGHAPAKVSTYGMLKWEDDDTASQDASTLEGVGEGDDLDTTYKPGQAVTGKLVLDVGRKGGVVSYVGTDDPDAEAAFQVRLPK